ncbi:MAG: ABC transporter permease [Melioribacteraceae bacterium]|nr:ABC transporter permease [Melioribacteraceae bacterium]MCF8355485.1 ABC transporter permease [Melioribacteraceae bacterium]MCF8394910.1 ABC transporter permease [Melioribacteraceae bacterium]MCF8420448.1 ABC transporter permease [Melioribacteraceae bacterium]
MRSYLFELKEGLLISLKAIRANKIRSVLTTLGIIIGVWAVVTMSTAIQGIDQAFQKGVSSLGSDNLYIDKWAWFNNDIPWWELRNRKNLSMDDYEKYAQMAKLPQAIAPTQWTRQTVTHDEKSLEFVNIQGTIDDYIRTTNLSFSDGRFFNELESKGSRNVAVLGHEIANKLFDNSYIVNQYIRIKGQKFKVIGVLEEQGSWVMGDFNPDNQVFVPIGTVFKYMQRENSRSITINVRAASSLDIDNVKEEAVAVMRRVRGLTYDQKNDFSINQQEGLLSAINDTVGVIQVAGLFITGLALFVGAIGIMNIMFVSVKERTKEIGIRKAIGAKRRTILGQFISESAVICLLGGMIGLGLALLSSLIMNQIDFPTTVQVDAVVLAVVISVMTGIFSGLAPAYTAAKMDPVEALRYE